MNYSQMLKKIRREFPTLKWKNYRCLNQGFDHLVIILDDKIVFRSPKSSPESSHNEKNELFLESKLLAYLRKKLTIQIPVYIYISRDKSLAGYKLVPGAELTAKNFAQLSLEQQASVASQLANFLTTLHRSPKEIAINYRIKTDRPRQEFIILKRNIKQYLFPKLKSSEKKIISDYLSELELSLKNK